MVNYEPSWLQPQENGEEGEQVTGCHEMSWKMTSRTSKGSSWSLWTGMKKRFCYRSPVTFEEMVTGESVRSRLPEPPG